MNNDLKYFTIPNILTLFNLIAGSFAIFYAFEMSDKLYLASLFIFIALIFDFLDGFVARLLKSESKIGAQLDSLSDLVSFGIAPAVISFQMLKKYALEIISFSVDLAFVDIIIMISPILLIVAAALRLAKFNSDDRQSSSFMGLATPASALFFASLPLLYNFDPNNLIILKTWLDVNLPFDFILAIIGIQVYILTNFWFYAVSIVVFSILQLVDLPMFSFKFKDYSFSKNNSKYIFIIISFILLIFLQSFIIPFIVILYILFSVGDDIGALFGKK